MLRPKLDMSEEVFAGALDFIRHFRRKGTQGEVLLSGVGESTLHPQLGAFARRTRAVLGPDVSLLLTTNGLRVDDALCADLALARAMVFLSVYEGAGPVVCGKQAGALPVLCRHGLLGTVTNQPAATPMSWAGQVDWPDGPKQPACAALADRSLTVFSDGRVSVCHMDARGDTVIGTVRDDPETFDAGVTSLCASCPQRPA